jgi:hypothetical protein
VAENEEGDVNSYWRNLRKTQDTVNCKRKHCIAFYGEPALEETRICHKTNNRMNELKLQTTSIPTKKSKCYHMRYNFSQIP